MTLRAGGADAAGACGMTTDQQFLLATALQVSVPLALMDLADAPAWQVSLRRQNAQEMVIAHADEMMYLSRPHRGWGGTRQAFRGLADAIAILSRQPGGVPFAGYVWCADHFPGGKSGHERCPKCLGDAHEQ